jgi:hypothetical protein
MSFQFQDAARVDTHLLIAIAGASGSGKTMSAMELATGICGSEPFAVIDTEAGRALHYADQYRFKHADFAPPFTPERYLEAARAAEKAGFKAVVIDSMSHEFDGEGGIMEAADNSGGVGPGKWLKPKMRHKAMMNGFLQIRTHLIFCLRAEEKIDMSQKDDRGKVIVTSQGWIPIQEKRFMFEMTASFTLSPSAPGVVDTSLPHKVQDQHRMAFIPGQHINREAGTTLAAWSQGTTIEQPHKELWQRARTIAQEGREKLTLFWRQVATPEEKHNLRPIVSELGRAADRADRNRGLE